MRHALSAFLTVIFLGAAFVLLLITAIARLVTADRPQAATAKPDPPAVEAQALYDAFAPSKPWASPVASAPGVPPPGADATGLADTSLSISAEQNDF